MTGALIALRLLRPGLALAPGGKTVRFRLRVDTAKVWRLPIEEERTLRGAVETERTLALGTSR